jgi:hypothetical protein
MRGAVLLPAYRSTPVFEAEAPRATAALRAPLLPASRYTPVVGTEARPADGALPAALALASSAAPVFEAEARRVDGALLAALALASIAAPVFDTEARRVDGVRPTALALAKREAPVTTAEARLALGRFGAPLVNTGVPTTMAEASPLGDDPVGTSLVATVLFGLHYGTGRHGRDWGGVRGLSPPTRFPPRVSIPRVSAPRVSAPRVSGAWFYIHVTMDEAGDRPDAPQLFQHLRNKRRCSIEH